MRFSVRFLRRNGRILYARDVANQTPIVADLQVDECYDELTRRYLRTAQLFQHGSGVPVRLKPRLFDARLIGVGADKLSLTGFERVDGVEYVQSWLVARVDP
jgi:hypothetical protein